MSQAAPVPGFVRLALPALVLGAIGIAFSPIFVRLSELGPTATGFHRVFLALPLLWGWLAVTEPAQHHTGGAAGKLTRTAPVVNRNLRFRVDFNCICA